MQMFQISHGIFHKLGRDQGIFSQITNLNFMKKSREEGSSEFEMEPVEFVSSSIIRPGIEHSEN